jgi:hypothetical protein
MFKKIAMFLFPAAYVGLKIDAVDRDGDGLVQEGTPFERKITVTKKAVKKATVKKTVSKKAVVKRSPSKKAAKKAPVKKAVKKK